MKILTTLDLTNTYFCILCHRKYLPILKKYPTEYIYEPWKAPLSVQKAANCIIGKDYPKPIVQHEVISKENMAKMKMAYQKKEEGSDGNKRKKTKQESSPTKITKFMKKK